MQPLDPKAFFTQYLVDHYYHKQITLKKILDNYSSLKDSLLNDIENISDKSYCTSIRAEIRANYFQAIETLFELIFCLDGKNVEDDKNLWYNLSTSKWQENFAKISKIAVEGTKFLENPVKVIHKTKGRIEIPLVQYIFYFGIDDEIPIERFTESKATIKKAIQIFALEFSERDEYNALKHSIRLFPALKNIEFTKCDTNESIAKIDLTNSMTFLKEEKDGSFVEHTKLLDTERDCRLTYFCSKMISNIIRSRRLVFSNQSVTLYTFRDAELAESEKYNIPIQNLRLTQSKM